MQIVQAMVGRDQEKRYRFCFGFHEAAEDDSFLSKQRFGDEATFHASGKGECRYGDLI